MAYNSGAIIDDGDYNTFVTGTTTGSANHGVNNVNSIWAGGTGDKGYGQAGALAAVTPGSIITATQWANLFNRMTVIASHQNTTITPLTSPAVGNEITAYNALYTNLADIWNNRLNCAAIGTPIVASTSRTTSWQNALTYTHTITWGSAAQRRYFFNSGGRIRLFMARSGGAANAKNTAWTTLLSDIGGLSLSGASGSGTALIAGTTHTGFLKTGGGGTMTTYNTGIGFPSTTTSYQTLLLQYASSYVYNTNSVRVRVKRITNGLVIETLLTDSEPDADVVNGTTNVTCNATPPATTYISNSWGTPTVVGAVTGS